MSTKHTIVQKTKRTFSDYLVWGIKNLAVAGMVYILLNKMFEIQPGYNWARDMLKSNMELINQNPHVPIDQKLAFKLGNSYGYLMYLRSQTPDSAVILLPAQGDFTPKGQKSDFTGEPFHKLWALRFLYPRKVVVPREMDKSSYAKEITHVAIVNGRGFERLNYTPKEKIEHGILPVNPN